MGTEIGRLGGYGFQGTVAVGDGSNQKGGKNRSRVCEPAEQKEKAAEEGGTQGGRIQLESSGTSGLCLGVMQHPCDKAHDLLVRQLSAAAGCEKVGRRRRPSDMSTST